jgi:hypothetical protein
MNIDQNDLPDDEERRLRELVGDTARRTSAAHDDAVLAAAREVARGRRRPGLYFGWFRAVAGVTAAIVVVIGIATLIRQAPPVSNDLLRGDDRGVSPANDERLQAVPTELAWPAQPGASAYVVVLRDAAATVLWTSMPLAESRIDLPAGARDAIQARGTYLWSVEVRGVAARELGPYWFHIE